MKQKLIGTYDLGHEQVDLFAILDDSGGEFYFMPETKALPRIKVGLDYPEWENVVSTLLHEAFEFVLARHFLRFVPCGKFNNDHADYLFAFTHPQFGMACSHVARFVTPALPALAAAYKQHRSKRK